jgi:hypothetical protein
MLSKPNSVYLSGLIILLFAILFAISASKPLQLDNMDFPAVAAQTAATGVPIYYRGEENSRATGLYHPPLYIYLLAAWIKLIGYGEMQVRLFGMFCAILQGFIVLEIMRTLFGPAFSGLWRSLFWLLFLLNPYTLQTAAIADIDSTIYGPLLCLAVLATLRISWRRGEWRKDALAGRDFLLLGIAIVLCLWAKLTTILLVFPFVFLLLIARMGVFRAAAGTAVLVSLSIAVFWFTYVLYGQITGMDVNFTFAFTWMSFLQRGSSATPGLAARLQDQMNNFVITGPFMLSWTGLIPWIAAPAGILVAFRSAALKRDNRSLHYGLVICLAFLTSFYYFGKTHSFGSAPFKYTFVYWGLILTAPLFLLFQTRGNAAESEARWPRGRLLTAFVVLCGMGVLLGHAKVRDSLMLDGFHGPFVWAVFLPAAAYLAALALAGFQTSARILALLVLSFYGGLQLGVGIYQSKVQYATTYDYGQSGFEETVSFLKLNTRPDEVIASMKDIGYSAGRRYFETYSAIYGDSVSEAALIKGIERGAFGYIVFTESRGQDQLIVNPRLNQWIAQHCTLVRSFGNYRVYKRTRGLAATPQP